VIGTPRKPGVKLRILDGYDLDFLMGVGWRQCKCARVVRGKFERYAPFLKLQSKKGLWNCNTIYRKSLKSPPNGTALYCLL
jgi:hypothetical protein